MNLTAIAFHEAAHGVAAILAGVAVKHVTIRPTGTSGGHMKPTLAVGACEPEALLLAWLCGGAAERKLTGKAAVLDATDLEEARLLAAILTEADPDAQVTIDRRERYNVLADARVELNWEWIGRVATALMRKQTLGGGEIADVM